MHFAILLKIQPPNHKHQSESEMGRVCFALAHSVDLQRRPLNQMRYYVAYFELTVLGWYWSVLVYRCHVKSLLCANGSRTHAASSSDDDGAISEMEPCCVRLCMWTQTPNLSYMGVLLANSIDDVASWSCMQLPALHKLSTSGSLAVVTTKHSTAGIGK